MSEIAVIIPHRNGGERLLSCLLSIVETLPMDHEIWLVDDYSDDDSLENLRTIFPNVRILAFKQHRGAAAARNAGLAATQAQHLLCIDADVICTPGCLIRLINALNQYDIAFPNLISETGDRLNPRSSFSERICLNSAVFGIRRDSLNRMDSWFDETIGIYGEDNDFFLRANRLSLKFCYVKDAQAIHPRPTIIGERHFYLSIRNAIYVWLKLRCLVEYWMLMDIWIFFYLTVHLGGAVVNRSLIFPSIPYTHKSRLRLFHLFFKALLWNYHLFDHTIIKRQQFRRALQHENSNH